jgi:hypothetical protein
MPCRSTTEVQFFWRDCFVHLDFRSGVSLHSHTMYSEESLDVVPRWAVGYGRRDLRNGFWTPPLTPLQAYRLEQKQIEAMFRLPGLISLTDHDVIRGTALLRVLEGFQNAPISTEWTVPFGPTFFHIGVHNLPPAQANTIMEELTNFTSCPEARKLRRLLAMLSSEPNLLLVLNHPLWDEKGLGRTHHLRQVRELLEQYGQHLHALEVNGLRSWSENELVIRMGHETGLPVIAGGDRHGLEPNAILNLSRATTIEEFVEEVRVRRFSHVVLMPQYRQPRRVRILHTVIDVLRDYPDGFEGRRSWPERVFYRDPESKAALSFATVDGGVSERLVKRLVNAMQLIDKRPPSAILTSA